MHTIYVSDGYGRIKATENNLVNTDLLVVGNKLAFELNFDENIVSCYMNNNLLNSFHLKNMKENLLYPAVGIISFNYLFNIFYYFLLFFELFYFLFIL